MKLYYVGNIVCAKEIKPFEINIMYSKLFDHRSENNSNFRLSNKIFNYICSYLPYYKNDYEGITNNELNEYLKLIPFSDLYYQHLQKEKIVVEIIEDESGMFYGKELLTGLLFPLNNKSVNSTFYYIDNQYESRIEKIDTYKDKNLERFSCILILNEAANANYINSYISKNKGNKSFISSITKYYNDNVFNKEIVEKEKEPDLRQNEITKIMGTIEYLLNLIKINNNNLYLEQKEKYNDLFKDPDEKYMNASKFKYREPSKSDLLKFLSNLKISLLICKSNCNNLNEYLDIIIKKYLSKNINNENSETDLQINDIDNIMELFLSDKEKYNAIEQRNILNKIAKLYILIIKLNNNSIIDLDKSYFKDDLDGIYSEMISLYNEGTIDNCPNIENIDVTLENTFNEVININFKKMNKGIIKKLVK